MTAYSDRVLEAVRDWAKTEHSPFNTWHAEWGAARQLGLDSMAAVTPHARFRAQVARALRAMTEHGELIRVLPGGLAPDGTQLKPGSHALYYPPQAHAAGDADRSRWEAVHDTLAGTGIENQARRGEPVQLDLGTWELLAATLNKPLQPDWS